MIKILLLSIYVMFFISGLNYQIDIIHKEGIKIEKRINLKSSEFQQTKLVSKNVLDGALKLLIPDDFVLMDAEMLNYKYPRDANRPTLVYTDINGEINVAFSYTQNKVSIADIPKMKETILTQFKQVPSINLIDSELKKINKKEFFVIKFYSQAIDTKVYNIMFGTEINGRLLIGTFNCTIAHFEEWKDTADEIVNSIEVL